MFPNQVDLHPKVAFQAGTLQAAYLSCNNGFIDILKLAEETLGKVVKSGRVPAIPGAELQSAIYIQPVVDTIVQSVLYSSRSIFLVPEIVG